MSSKILNFLKTASMFMTIIGNGTISTFGRCQLEKE